MTTEQAERIAIALGIIAESMKKPDRWQAWYRCNSTDKAPDPPEGYTPAGPWEPYCFSQSESDGVADYTRDWRRPLRKVTP